MDLAGEVLRKRREDLGLAVGEIADLLKIRADYLVAIENDSLEKLPASVYTTGYIRCYAKYLNVNANSVIDYYTKHLSQPPPSMIFPIAFSRKKSPKVFIYTILAAFGLFAFFIVHPYVPHAWTDEIKLAWQTTPKEAPAYAYAPSLRGQNVIEASNEHSLGITANDKTWISIKFKDGNSQQMLLYPGDSKNWKFSDKALLKIGNAGGIKLRINGRDIGSPGSLGQVKTLSLPEY